MVDSLSWSQRKTTLTALSSPLSSMLEEKRSTYETQARKIFSGSYQKTNVIRQKTLDYAHCLAIHCRSISTVSFWHSWDSATVCAFGTILKQKLHLWTALVVINIVLLWHQIWTISSVWSWLKTVEMGLLKNAQKLRTRTSWLTIHKLKYDHGCCCCQRAIYALLNLGSFCTKSCRVCNLFCIRIEKLL